MRLIDADALIKNIKNTADLGGWIGAAVYHIKQVAIKYIDEAPTVVEFKDPITRVMVRGVEYIPVVRCKNCIHYESDVCSITDMVGDNDDYYSYGVREEGE